jgi:hypothetical protein
VAEASAAEEPFAIAVRSQERLARALELIGIAVGPGALRLYADVDALGAPILVAGPMSVELAARLSSALEDRPAPIPEGDVSCT